MPTTDKSHGQNANLGWHFVRLAFCPVGILSGWHFVHTPFRSPAWPNDRWHCRQVGALSLLWTTMCVFRFPTWLNDFSHSEQGCIFSSLWVSMCIVSMLLELIDLEHCAQVCLFAMLSWKIWNLVKQSRKAFYFLDDNVSLIFLSMMQTIRLWMDLIVRIFSCSQSALIVEFATVFCAIYFRFLFLLDRDRDRCPIMARQELLNLCSASFSFLHVCCIAFVFALYWYF